MSRYVPIWVKYIVACLAGTAWALFSFNIAEKWMYDLSEVLNAYIAYLIIFGIAIIPGFMNAFLISSLLMDRRPRVNPKYTHYPDIDIIIAAYNEEENILGTIQSIERQQYPGMFRVIAVNDGSSDRTGEILDSISRPWLVVVHHDGNKGKSAALNTGLALVESRLTLTIDGDSYLYKDALRNLVGRYLSDPVNTAAVAGAPLVRNSRVNLCTRAQEWDYFHGISAIKRLQSLYQGTLVAQGAFSLYETAVLREVGGWSDTVGEDIVLTWAILKAGYRVGFAENACLFTNAPATWMQFIRQRQRWSRGLIEGFKDHWQLLFKKRYSTLFIWWNLFFPYMDLVYTFAFIPGIILAFFGYYYIAGPITLLVLPLAMIVNYIMFRTQKVMFDEQGLEIRRNIAGFMFYSLLYSLVLQPVCTIGYIIEFFSRTKKWGTK